MKQEHDFCGDVRRELMSTALERIQGR